MSRGWSIALLVIGTISILIASVGFWARTSVLSESGFVDIVDETFAQENVRIAIADEIINQVLSDRPLVRQLVQGPAENLIASILDTSLVQGAVDLMARVLYRVVVLNDGQEVAINIEPIKDVLAQLTNILNVDVTDQINPDDIPNQIVIVEEGAIPSLDPIWDVADWGMVVFGIIGIVLLVLVFWRGWSTPNRNDYFKWTGGVLVVGTVIMLLVMFPLGTTAERSVDTDSGRVLVSATYDNIVKQLRIQSIGLFLLGIGLWVLGWWLGREQRSRAGVVVTEPSGSDEVVEESAIADDDSVEEAPAPA